MSPDGNSYRRWILTLQIFFFLVLVAEISWIGISVTASGFLSSLFDQRERGLIHLLLLGSLALSSGLLLLGERSSNTFNEPEHQWTLAETLYVLALFASLFFGVYAFFIWYFAPS